MNTEYRIQTPGKKTSMYMPHSSLNSATQPTHRHGFSETQENGCRAHNQDYTCRKETALEKAKKEIGCIVTSLFSPHLFQSYFSDR